MISFSTKPLGDTGAPQSEPLPCRFPQEGVSFNRRAADRPGFLDQGIQRGAKGRWCFGKTPMQTFLDAMPMTKEKMIAA
jgi:hypothetical protein